MKRTIINLYLINIFFALFEIKGISASDTCEEWSEWSACTHGISTRKCLSDLSILDETLVCTKCDKWGVWSECKDGKKHRKVMNCPFIKEEQECDVDNDMEDDTSTNNNYIYFNVDEEENENENNNISNNNISNNNIDNNNVDVDENYNDDEEDVKNNDLNNSSTNSNNNDITNFTQVNDKMTTTHKTTNIYPVNFIQQKYTKSNRHRSDDFSKILNSMNNMNTNNHTHRSSSSNNTKNFNTYRGNSYMHPHFSNYMSSSVSNTAREEKKTGDDADKIEHDNITKEERIVPTNTQHNNINNNHHHNNNNHHHHHHGRSDIHEHDTSYSVDGDKHNSNKELPSLSTYDYDMNNDSYKNNYMKKLRDTVKEEQTKLNNNQNNEKLSSSEKHNDDMSALYEHMNAKDQDHKQQEQSDSSSNSHFENYSKLYIASGIGTLVLLGGSIATYFLYKEKKEKVVQEEVKEENFEVMFNDDAVKGKDNKAMDEEEFWALE
ncbi:merozoite TRAP-like protein [Plasmodium sp. gorilla clade G2]|uniref:merozoite TRAP-like protein n=1 Tax=Plasmodium sp. gorilla clade G2 TaxID=880535 RepID=UPI000D213A25|nr:merozoite TRAP-like protein [Plasmodium sp. gorilla clade G2]SOV15097.1 merozoite TRAP-like protein [Plasmodium sp. gorilla clade G2]